MLSQKWGASDEAFERKKYEDEWHKIAGLHATVTCQLAIFLNLFRCLDEQ